MQEIIKQLVLSLFSNPTLATIFISMFPVIEIKGAIPFGQNTQIWGVDALSPIASLLCALLGGLIVSTLLLTLLKLTFRLLNFKQKYKSVVDKIKATFSSKIKKIEKENRFKTYLYLFLFVAIPLPLTGTWTAALAAAILNLDFFKSLLVINLGNVVAGIIIYLISTLSPSLSIYIFYFFAACLILTVVFYSIKIIITNLKENKKAWL